MLIGLKRSVTRSTFVVHGNLYLWTCGGYVFTMGRWPWKSREQNENSNIKLLKFFMISVILFKMGKHSDF